MKRICKYCDHIKVRSDGRFTKFACDIDEKMVRKGTQCPSTKRLTSFSYKQSPTVLENTDPVVVAGSPETITLPTLDTVLSGAFTDELVESAVTILWTYVSAGAGVATITDDAALSTGVSFDIVDVYTFTLSIDDGINAAVTDDVVITVAADATPVVTVPSNDAVTMVNPDDEVYQVVGASVAEEGEVSTFAWTYSSVGAGVASFTDDSVLNPEVTFDIADTYTLILTATDVALNTDNDSFDVVVSDKDSPVVNVGISEVVAQTDTIDLVGVVTKEGDEVVYAWTYASVGAGVATIDDDTAKVTTATVDIDDQYTFTLTVDDQVNAPVPDDKEVIVE
jgi:hypothetical protein